NLRDFLRSRGLTTTSKVRKIWDYGGGLGGPIMRDKLWFYGATRFWGTQEYNVDQYVNKLRHTLFYEADRSQQWYTDIYNRDISGRLTLQAGAKHKITISHSDESNSFCNFTS